MTPLVCMLAGLLAAPSDTAFAEGTPGGEVELLISIDAALLATLESGGEVTGDIPPTARRVSWYRLRIASGALGASGTAIHADSIPPGTDTASALELLIPVDASLLSRLRSGSEVVGAIPAAAHDAARYRLQLAGTSRHNTTTWRASLADGSTVAPVHVNAPDAHVFSVTPTAASSTASSGLSLPGPERTTPQPPAMIATSPSATSLLAPPGTANATTLAPPPTNHFAPVVSSTTDLVANTVTAAKSILHLPPPPSDAATLSPTYTTTPHLAGLLSLPPPPGTQAPAPYTAPLSPVARAPIGYGTPPPTAPEPTKMVTPVRTPAVVAKPAAVPSGLAPPGSDVGRPSSDDTAPSSDDAAAGKDETDLVNAKTDATGDSRPWAVLSFSLLGLFVSIGGNFFLGWIAWDHRGRYLGLLRKLRREKARA